MTEWYELDEDERVKQVYAKHTLEDFWKWWSREQPAVMEIRIKDFDKIKLIKEKYKLPTSLSGVYVTNANDIKRVLKELRNNTVMWFGINPKKKSYSSKYKYWGYNGEDQSIKEIGYIFIDIDRVTKMSPATNTELCNANEVADKILERLGEYKWNESYIKICSAHGLQLLIQLDDPILLPEREINITKEYQYNEEYETLKKLVKGGIGHEIIKFAKKFKDTHMVEVDFTGMNMGRVAALPCSKNLKYDTERWRGIVEIKNGKNEGLTDYIYTKIKDLKTFKKNNTFSSKKVGNSKYLLVKGKMLENPLVRMILDNDFSKGDRHFKIVFPMQMLIRDSGLDYTNKELQKVIKLIEEKTKGPFDRSIPDKAREFSTDQVNKYCIDNMIPPVYPLWENSKPNGYQILPTISFDDIIVIKSKTNTFKLDGDNSLREDILKCTSELGNCFEKNTTVYYDFIRGCFDKYGEEKTKFYFDHKIILEGLKRGVWFDEDKK